MINTLKPGSAQGHDEQRGQVLERVQQQYGKPDEKQREAVKKLGKDEFFKIMITQIQHQDPLKPYQNEQMAAQMAQFTSLEQMVNMNQNLEKLTQAQQPLHNLGAANLIGKYVTADSGRIVHTEGKFSNLNFELPTDAQKVHINIINERGENVAEIEKANLAKGKNTIEWDGKKSNNMAASTGQYIIQISAVDEKDRSIQVATQKTSVVHGIGFEGKETVLLTGDIKNPEKLLLSNVSKIVDPGEAGKIAPTGGAPSISGLPPGMNIQGLENLIGSQEKVNSDIKPGSNSKFMSVNMDAMRKAQEKPDIMPKVSEDDIRKIIAEGPDLTAANPAAAAMKAGQPLPGAKKTSDANPAAVARNSAAGQSVQSSVDGSTAGTWAE